MTSFHTNGESLRSAAGSCLRYFEKAGITISSLRPFFYIGVVFIVYLDESVAAHFFYKFSGLRGCGLKA